MTDTSQKILMMVMDGWGLNKPYEGNAVHLANTPTYDQLWAGPAAAQLGASGRYVGLPPGQMGNSEVGHLTIGSGRIKYQDLVKINKAIETGSFFQEPVLLAAIEHAKQHNSRLHIKGLYSPGGVHSHQKHINALLQLAKNQGLKSDQVFLHLITDGRDVPPRSAQQYLAELEKLMSELNFGRISTLVGRYYAMDRDHNWERTNQAFELLTAGKGQQFDNVQAAIEQSYDQDISDEFIKPCKIGPVDQGLIKDNDAVIFANFRSDRPRQLVERFLERGPDNLYYATMTTYNDQFPVKVVYPETKIEKTLAEIISQAGLTQLHITETVKYPHLTYYLNGKYEQPFPLEDRIMIDTYSDIDTHDQKPQMRTPEIKDEITADIKQGKHQVIFANFPNGDMVGHTGNIPAAIKGCETVDQALAEILPIAAEHHYHVMLLADHGNCEEMLDEETNEVITAHSSNPVPFILVSDRYQQLRKDEGGLADIAPTILTILGLDIPTEMTGESLV